MTPEEEIMEWYFDAYFVTDFGSGWDQVGGPYQTMEDANEAAQRFEERNDAAEKISVYPEIVDE